MKYLLGVRTSTPNDVVLTELGRLPLAYTWAELTKRYLQRFDKLSDDRLVKLAYLEAAEHQLPWHTATQRCDNLGN